MQKNRNVYIIAGPNGAGKTTFARKFLPDYAECDNFINADLIAQGLSPFSPRVAAMKSGRLVLERIRDFASKGEDFAFETTLSGKTYLSLLGDLKNQGYAVNLFFLWVPNVQFSLARIKDRVKMGGHDVPAIDVERRFGRGLKNLFDNYMPILDSWYLFDSSTSVIRLIANETNGTLVVKERESFDRIKQAAGK